MTMAKRASTQKSGRWKKAIVVAMFGLVPNSASSEEIDWETISRQAQQGIGPAWRLIEAQWTCDKGNSWQIIDLAICERRTSLVSRVSWSSSCSIHSDRKVWECVARHRDPALAYAVIRIDSPKPLESLLYTLLVQHGVYEALGLKDQEAFLAGIRARQPALIRAMMDLPLEFDPYEVVAESGTSEEMGLLIGEGSGFDPASAEDALTIAVKKDKTEMVRLLLNAGVRDDGLFDEAFSPSLKPRIVALLLAAGLRPKPSEVENLWAGGQTDEVLAQLASVFPPMELAAIRLKRDPRMPLHFLGESVDRELRRRGLVVTGPIGKRLLALGMDPDFIDFQRRGKEFDAFAVDGLGVDGLTHAFRRRDAALAAIYLQAFPAVPKPSPDGRTWLHEAASAGNFHALASLRRAGLKDSPDAEGLLPTDLFWQAVESERSEYRSDVAGAILDTPNLGGKSFFTDCDIEKVDGAPRAFKCQGGRALDLKKDTGENLIRFKVTPRRTLFRRFLQQVENFGLPFCPTSTGRARASTQGDQLEIVASGATGPFSVAVEVVGPPELESELLALPDYLVRGISEKELAPAKLRWVGPSLLLVIVGFLGWRYAPATLPWSRRSRLSKPIPTAPPKTLGAEPPRDEAPSRAPLESPQGAVPHPPSLPQASPAGAPEWARPAAAQPPVFREPGLQPPPSQPTPAFPPAPLGQPTPALPPIPRSQPALAYPAPPPAPAFPFQPPPPAPALPAAAPRPAPAFPAPPPQPAPTFPAPPQPAPNVLPPPPPPLPPPLPVPTHPVGNTPPVGNAYPVGNAPPVGWSYNAAPTLPSSSMPPLGPGVAAPTPAQRSATAIPAKAQEPATIRDANLGSADAASSRVDASGVDASGVDASRVDASQVPTANEAK